MADTLPFTVETHDGKKVTFTAPASASREQVETLAARALKQKFPDAGYQRPVYPKKSNEDYWREKLGDQGEISAHDPSIRDKAQGALAAFARPFAADERHAAQIGNRATAALDWTPLGNVMGLQEGASDVSRGLKSGDAATAGLGALSFALSLLPGVGGKARKSKGALLDMLTDESGAIRAWHGSPHDFDKFSLDKIGTGEGAQAYGHGLYFAENKGVAESYIPNANWHYKGKPAEDIYNEMAAKPFGPGITNEEMYFWEKVALGHSPAGARSAAIADAAEWPEYAEFAKRINPEDFTRKGGGLYEVNINAEPEDFLDWDAPVMRQPSSLQQILQEKYRAETLAEAARLEQRGSPQAAASYRRYADDPEGAIGKYGADPLYRFIPGKHGATPDALEMDRLTKAGIPGIRYLDQGSRGASAGTRNYVVFDDSLIDILAKH